MKKVSRRFQRQIPAYLEGTLSVGARRRFERQLRNSEACRHELTAYERLLRIAPRAPVEYPSEYAWSQFLPRLHQRIEREYAFEAGRKGMWWRWGMLSLGFVEVGCALLLVAFGLGIVGQGESLSRQKQGATAETLSVREVSVSQGSSDALETIAEIWVTPAMARRLASLDPAKVAPPTLMAPAGSLPLSEATDSASAGQEAASRSAEVNPAGVYWRLMESSLPPTRLYSEEASYLLASLR